MTCCQCEGIESEFNRKTAIGNLEQYRKKGPAQTTRLLLDALHSEGVEGMTLLDVGGGVGVIEHELLRAGVRSAVDVDASTAYIEAAKQEAARQGHADRINFHHGDFVAVAPEISPADIVTLDRVICCYHDMHALVGLSAARARKLYGVVYPRDTWWMKLALRLGNVYFRIKRSPFRVYAHPTAAVEAILRDNGLTRRFYRTANIWQVAVYAR